MFFAGTEKQAAQCKYRKEEETRNENPPQLAASTANQPRYAYLTRPKRAELSCTIAVGWRC